MESINKHNYEAYWLDYLEGNLDEASIDLMFVFFEKYPELKPEMTEEDLIKVIPTDEIIATKKSLFHKEDELEEKMVFLLDNELNADEAIKLHSLMAEDTAKKKIFDQYAKIRLTANHQISIHNKLGLKRSLVANDMLIAHIEGILTYDENKIVEELLASDETTSYHYNLFNACKLEANKFIVCPNKDNLKKKGAKVVWLKRYWIPASIAASILLFFAIRSVVQFNDTTSLLPLAINKSSVKNNSTISTHKLVLPLQQSVEMASIHLNNKLKIKQENISLITKEQIPKEINVARNDSVYKAIVPQPEISTEEEYAYNKIAINVYKETEAMVNSSSETNKKPTPTLFAEKFNESVWGKDKVETKSESGKKIKGFDVVGMLGKAFKKLGSQRSDAKKIENEDEDYTQYVVTLGGLSLKKTVHN